MLKHSPFPVCDKNLAPCVGVRETETRPNPPKLKGLSIEKQPPKLFSLHHRAVRQPLKLFQTYSTLIYNGTLQNQEPKLGKITAKSEIIGYGKAHKEPSNSDLKLLPSLNSNPSPHSSPISSVIVKIAPSSHHTSGSS